MRLASAIAFAGAAFLAGNLVGHHQTCRAAAYAIEHTNDGIAYSTDLIEAPCAADLDQAPPMR